MCATAHGLIAEALCVFPTVARGEYLRHSGRSPAFRRTYDGHSQTRIWKRAMVDFSTKPLTPPSPPAPIASPLPAPLPVPFRLLRLLASALSFAERDI